MTAIRSFLLAGAAVALFALPTFASAAALSSAQASAIVGLLQAFGADQSVVLQVEQALGLMPITSTTPTAPAPAAAHVPVVGSLYRSSNTGFDFSYNTPLYPMEHFSFGILGVTHGKAFTQNPLLAQEYSWATLGAGTPPTVYMNLNAPYGSTVAGHTASPKPCPVATVGTASTTSPQAEPIACAGYNYGYQAAQSAYAYASSVGVTSPLWWLDIEEANSWSEDVTVNDATIQGAIDYLNSKNARVGIYSMGYMWNAIAGAGFVPQQTIGGQAVPIPSWLPIGITDLVGAINSCNTRTSFMPGSPVWLIQYVTSSTAIDQSFAC